MVTRNYNEIRVMEEREGQGDYNEERPTRFNDAIEDAALRELPPKGGSFT